MGKHTRKRKGLAKVTVMEEEAAASRKRKLLLDESEISMLSSIQIKTQRSGEVRPASSSGNSTCDSGSSGDILAPCCSSTVVEESSNFADLKENETTVEFSWTTGSDLVDFTEREPTESNSGGCSAVGKMPTKAELEEFFAAAETNLQRQFIDKYNYDIAKDEPLDGRYEWVQV